MYRVSRSALSRVSGAPVTRLDELYTELAPLHAALRQEAGQLPSAGALIQAPLLYLLVRVLRPGRVIETGISSGYSARLILEALERNGGGHLDSIGIDVFGMSRTAGAQVEGLAGRHVGWLVPDRLKSRWDLHLGKSDDVLPGLVGAGRPTVDLFLHDSLHQYATMRWEYDTAFPSMTGGGLLASHDVHANRAWPEFLAEHRLRGDAELDHDLGVVRIPPAPATGALPTPGSG